MGTLNTDQAAPNLLRISERSTSNADPDAVDDYVISDASADPPALMWDSDREAVSAGAGTPSPEAPPKPQRQPPARRASAAAAGTKDESATPVKAVITAI